MDDKAKRRLSLRNKTNHELFTLYYDRLKVKLSEGQYEQYKQILDKLLTFLGEFPPSVELATQFLARYTNRAQSTRRRYTGMVRGFMEWYEESLDFNVKKPHLLPQYVEPAEIERLVEFIQKKKNHKRTIERDVLLVRFATKTGLRRSELADLIAGDIHLNQKVVIVRKGKGNKGRAVPLENFLIPILSEFLKNMKPDDSVFCLTERSITDKVSVWSKKAGLKLHPHSFRHFFAEQLLDRGTPLTVVSSLLGHENLETTAAYLGLRPGSLREAINKLGTPNPEGEDNTKKPSRSGLPEVTGAEAGDGRRKLLEKPPIKQDQYVETPHKQKIREVAKLLAEAISLPSCWDKDLWRDFPLEFKPGQYYLPIGLVEIDNDKQIKTKYYDIGAGIAEPYLLKGLHSHLSTSGLPKFAEIVGNNGELTSLVDRAGQYSQELVTLVKLIADDVERSGVKVNFKDETEPGITRWFIITVWNDAIQKAGGHSWINSSWYKPHESIPGAKWQLRCGPYVIGIAKNEITLDAYSNLHKRLRASYAKGFLAKNINAKGQEMSNVDQEIKQRLHEFIDMERLPGRCDLC